MLSLSLLPPSPISVSLSLCVCVQSGPLLCTVYYMTLLPSRFEAREKPPVTVTTTPRGGDTTSLLAWWQYVVRPYQWMYNKGLLDCHDFLKSLIDFLENTT